MGEKGGRCGGVGMDGYTGEAWIRRERGRVEAGVSERAALSPP